MKKILYITLLMCLKNVAENRIPDLKNNNKIQALVQQQFALLEKKLEALLSTNTQRSVATYILIQELQELKKVKSKSDPRSKIQFHFLKEALFMFARKHDLLKNLDELAQTNLTVALD